MSDDRTHRVSFATGELLNEWTKIAHGLTPEERLDVLAYFVRVILDKGEGTWVWPPQEQSREQAAWPLVGESASNSPQAGGTMVEHKPDAEAADAAR